VKHNRVVQLTLHLIIALVGISTSVVAQSVDGRIAKQQTGLSGTYRGIINFPERRLYGIATLKISGDQFSLENYKFAAEKQERQVITVTGRISIVTTGDYTAVALQVNDTVPPRVISLSAHMIKGGLLLKNVPGEHWHFSFVTYDILRSYYGQNLRRPRYSGDYIFRGNYQYLYRYTYLYRIFRKRVPEGEALTFVSNPRINRTSIKRPQSRRRSAATRAKRPRH
jgi:hypothetical protein